jgi:TonB family protein
MAVVQGVNDSMTCTRTLILALSIAGLLASASAKEKDKEAKALVQKATDLSDIRKEGAPPFRLKANLKITNDDGSVMDGTYTEFWVSKAQWRKEMVIRDFRRTKVAVDRKMWTLDSSSTIPNRIGDLEGAFDLWTQSANPWKVEKFEDLQIDGTAAHCFRTKPEIWGITELCFDKTSGAILEKTDLVENAKKAGEYTRMYGSYQPFGDRLVATSFLYLKDKKTRVQAKVSDLTIRPELDPTLFAPLAGGKEFSHCPSSPQHPTAIYAPVPHPHTQLKGDERVTVSVFVGADGKPHDPKVLASVNDDYDQAALEAVRQWRFKPSSCEGKPIEEEIAIEVDFNYR